MSCPTTTLKGRPSHPLESQRPESWQPSEDGPPNHNFLLSTELWAETSRIADVCSHTYWTYRWRSLIRRSTIRWAPVFDQIESRRQIALKRPLGRSSKLKFSIFLCLNKNFQIRSSKLFTGKYPSFFRRTSQQDLRHLLKFAFKPIEPRLYFSFPALYNSIFHLCLSDFPLFDTLPYSMKTHFPLKTELESVNC